MKKQKNRNPRCSKAALRQHHLKPDDEFTAFMESEIAESVAFKIINDKRRPEAARICEIEYHSFFSDLKDVLLQFQELCGVDLDQDRLKLFIDYRFVSECETMCASTKKFIEEEQRHDEAFDKIASEYKAGWRKAMNTYLIDQQALQGCRESADYDPISVIGNPNN